MARLRHSRGTWTNTPPGCAAGRPHRVERRRARPRWDRPTNRMSPRRPRHPVLRRRPRRAYVPTPAAWSAPSAGWPSYRTNCRCWTVSWPTRPSMRTGTAPRGWVATGSDCRRNCSRRSRTGWRWPSVAPSAYSCAGGGPLGSPRHAVQELASPPVHVVVFDDAVQLAQARRGFLHRHRQRLLQRRGQVGLVVGVGQ